MFALDLDTAQEPSGEPQKKLSMEQTDDEKGSRVAEMLLSSKMAQNWFFQNNDDVPTPSGRATTSSGLEAQMKAKEFNMWSPQTM